MFSIKTKLLFRLLPITLALLAALGYYNYLKSAEIFTRSVQENLHSIVSAKEGALVEYIKSTEKIGSAIAATDVVQTYAELTNRKLSGSNQEAVDKLGRQVENILYSFQEAHWGRYHHIFLINQSNRIVISPNHGAKGKGSPSPLLDRDTSSDRWAMAAMQKGATMVSDYWSWPAADHTHQVLFFPVRDGSNRVQAVIGFELQVSYQHQILTEGFDLGNTGRIYLTTAQGVPIAQKGVENQVPLAGDALAQAKLNGNSQGRRMNARGREVIGRYAKQSQYPWIIAAEIETDEAFSEFNELQKILLIGLAGALFILMVLLLMFANTIVRPVREMTSQLERISRGEFGIDIPDIGRKDEIGKLNGALQQLGFSLKIVAKKLREAKAQKKAG